MKTCILKLVVVLLLLLLDHNQVFAQENGDATSTDATSAPSGRKFYSAARRESEFRKYFYFPVLPEHRHESDERIHPSGNTKNHFG